MINERLNRAITEALGKCWHEWYSNSQAAGRWTCISCGIESYRPDQNSRNTDYATDERACVQLWETLGVLSVEPQETVAGKYRWRACRASWQKAVYAPTFCLAICKAFLKSKGLNWRVEG